MVWANSDSVLRTHCFQTDWIYRAECCSACEWYFHLHQGWRNDFVPLGWCPAIQAKAPPFVWKLLYGSNDVRTWGYPEDPPSYSRTSHKQHLQWQRHGKSFTTHLIKCANTSRWPLYTFTSLLTQSHGVLYPGFMLESKYLYFD